MCPVTGSFFCRCQGFSSPTILSAALKLYKDWLWFFATFCRAKLGNHRKSCISTNSFELLTTYCSQQISFVFFYKNKPAIESRDGTKYADGICTNHRTNILRSLVSPSRSPIRSISAEGACCAHHCLSGNLPHISPPFQEVVEFLL